MSIQEEDPYFAAKAGRLDLLMQFIEDDISLLNKPDETLSRTVLYYGALCGHDHIVDYLIGLGARVHVSVV